MNRTQLVNKLSQRMNVSKKIGELYFTSFLDSIMENIYKDGRIAIRGFGSFKVNEYKARIAKKPITGEIIELPIRRKISFHPGQELRKTINSEKPVDNNTKLFINNIQTSENILSVSP
jgi:integration host factor subunit beta